MNIEIPHQRRESQMAQIKQDMSNEEIQKLEDFIQDWHWNEKSHKFAQELSLYLFQFIDYLYEQKLSAKTVRQHMSNCWCIGILECQYGYKDEFSPSSVFCSPDAWYEYEFKRKISASKYALNSYRATWRKLYKYTKALGYLKNEQ